MSLSGKLLPSSPTSTTGSWKKTSAQYFSFSESCSHPVAKHTGKRVHGPTKQAQNVAEASREEQGGPHVTRTSLAHTGEHLNSWSLLSSHEPLAPLKSLASDSLIGTPERRPSESASDKPTPLSIPRSPLLGQPCHPERILPSSVGLFIWHAHSNVEVWLLVLQHENKPSPPPPAPRDQNRWNQAPWEALGAASSLRNDSHLARSSLCQRQTSEDGNPQQQASDFQTVVAGSPKTNHSLPLSYRQVMTCNTEKKMHDVLTCCGLTNEPSTLIHKHFPPKTEV